MKRARVYMHDKFAGLLTEDAEGFRFTYDVSYLQSDEPEPVSLTLPLQADAFESAMMFPFFDGLIPEGWLLEIAQRNWKLNPRDRMELLLHTCHDCIGAVSIENATDEA